MNVALEQFHFYFYVVNLLLTLMGFSTFQEQYNNLSLVSRVCTFFYRNIFIFMLIPHSALNQVLNLINTFWLSFKRMLNPLKFTALSISLMEPFLDFLVSITSFRSPSGFR